MSNIELLIKRLVVEGISIPRGGLRLLQAAVETELTVLLEERGLAPHLAEGVGVPGITSPAIQLNGGDGATALGQQIAAAVYGGIGM